MGRKVIFLDFDGVLNDFYPTFNPNEEQYQIKKTKLLAKNFIYERLHNDLEPKIWCVSDLDWEKVMWLNYIIEQTDADIVFSTAWRADGKLNLALYLAIMGFVYPEKCIGCTGRDKTRGLEIENWLKLNKSYDKYVIIDDEICDIMPHHDINCIQKVWGLNKEYADLIIEKLKD